MKLIDRLAPYLYIAWNNNKPAAEKSNPPFLLEAEDDEGNTLLRMQACVVKELSGNRVVLMDEETHSGVPTPGVTRVENVEQMEKFCAYRKDLYRQSPDYVPSSDGIADEQR